MNIKNNENFEICKKCGGQCCKNYGGFFHPSDLGEEITEEVIRKWIDRGDVSIDWYDGYGPKIVNGYFLRMRHKNGDILDPAFKGECVHLTPSGCDLKFDERAYGCKRLVPTDGKEECSGSYDKYEAATDWEPYHGILEKIASHTPTSSVLTLLSLMKSEMKSEANNTQPVSSPVKHPTFGPSPTAIMVPTITDAETVALKEFCELLNNIFVKGE